MFKWIGLIAGFVFLGFFGGLLGLFLGSLVDRARRLGRGALNPLTAARRQAVFLETVFVLMGKLAKSDGRISRQEVDHVEAFIKQLGLTPAHRKIAISQFKRGAAPDFDTSETLGRFMLSCGHTSNLRQMLLVYLSVLALADGSIDRNERAVLEQIGLQLGYSHIEIARLIDMVQGQAHFTRPRPDSPSALADAYKALGVSPDSSDQELKRAYRKLISQYHPDKLMGQGLPEDMIAVATEQAKEIQLAYDLIKKHRGLN